MSILTSNFGTGRGAIRLALSYGEVALGAAGISRPDPAAVRRLVFICHGNICRSAFADVAARAAGMRVAATIANEFTEADSPIYLSSLIALGFLLFVVTFIVLAIAKLMLMSLNKREGN